MSIWKWELSGFFIQVVTETVNIMEEHRSYPHERFALRRLTAGTLSSHAESECVYRL